MTRPTRLRTVYLVRQDQGAPEAVKPQVHIEVTATGRITYGVKASGRTLAKAREQAIREFRLLREEAVKMEGEKA